jgi:wyosine [tRNA(Phe)-imidazoG37] synthetase (radical SAM superfamily)
MTKCVFGPVPSRRLGRSLGVDLVPFKTCTYDCVYCQLGRTTCKTTERREWVSPDAVAEELRSELSTKPNYITLSGSGEPTLSLGLDQLIDRIKQMTRIPVAVLTNGSLLWREDVRRELLNADVVMPSLDAGDEATFERVNRPHEEIDFGRMLDGIIQFRRQYRGLLWLEILVLGGCTAPLDEFVKIAECVDRIAPDRIQLNTVTRPPLERSAIGVSKRQLRNLATLFHPRAEVIANYEATNEHSDFDASREAILELLRRRPCSIGDLARGLSIHRNEAAKYIDQLNSEGLVKESRMGEVTYFKTVPQESGKVR